MSDEMQKQVDAYFALPSRAERRAAYDALPEEVRVQVRSISEGRRGIASRVGGKIVLTKESYIATLTRLSAKDKDLDRRKANVAKKIEGLKAQLSANYGDEALAEATEALAGSNPQ